MARIRSIKPGFFLNDLLAELPPLDRILFAGLWTLADREGRLEDRIKKIKAAILPYDDHDIDEAINRLSAKNFIQRYEVKGCKYIQIENFLKHQCPNVKEVESIIPAPYKNRASTPRLRSSKGAGAGAVKEQEQEYIKPSRAPLTDEEFIQALKINPAYQGVDIEKELARMDAWLLTPKGSRRQKTRRFVLGWLDRADKPIQTGNSNGTYQPNYQDARTKAGGVVVAPDHFAGVTVRFDDDTNCN